jgi:hypothetical protein
MVVLVLDVVGLALLIVDTYTGMVRRRVVAPRTARWPPRRRSFVGPPTNRRHSRGEATVTPRIIVRSAAVWRVDGAVRRLLFDHA